MGTSLHLLIRKMTMLHLFAKDFYAITLLIELGISNSQSKNK